MPAYKDDKTGKWYVSFRYEDYTGKRKQKMKRGFERKKDAIAYEQDFLTNLQGTPDITFKQLYDDYIEDCSHRLRESTVSGKKFLITTKILPFYEDVPINKIDARSVRKWQNWLLQQKNKQGEPLSQTYIKTINNQLSAMFNYAVKFYELKSNPLHKTGSIGKKHADEMKFWTVDEFDKAMTYFNPDDPHDFQFLTIYNLLFYSGIRQGELLALTLNDFNFEDKTVFINKSYVRLNKEDIISEPKTPKSKRVIYLPDFIFEMLNKYVELLVDYEPNQRLFQVHKSSMTKRLDTASRNTGVHRIRIHDLRHSHASHLIELGCSALLVQERLGHEKIETTLQTYSHLYPNKQLDVITKINKVVSKRYQKEKETPQKH
ncbi:Tyrosine recombinase XerC [Bacillus licheniformis]|uniref:site-specific integrase n=1 Tax=Bacillus licheniformis TaxID=1402 RepID=UPI00119D9A7C|nr:site-specific integrase [Bacillus licheniformis]TWK08628.1 Tyrosine recombinase XerC [Bacillus licheniformis]